MELVHIFCNPLLHNIIQVKCLTLYEYASVKVISLKKKKKSDPHLTPYVGLGRHSLVVQSISDSVRTRKSGRVGEGASQFSGIRA